MKIPVTIAEIRQETPTVKSFTLDLGGQDFRFLPGQWLDCCLEASGKIEVAGYSMTSSPLTKATIQIAVKLVGENPVTNYLHHKAKIGDTLYIEGGSGDFFYEKGMGGSLVLIGGGIGITPLMSIVRYVDDVCPDARLTLFYSAPAPSALIFRDRLSEIAARNSNIRCIFTVTGNFSEPWEGHTGRIDADLLQQEDIDLGALFYVCGPPQMIQDVVATLTRIGVASSHINYEQWW
ncbi:MAG: ferredoxin--NADP reductase [Ardenticatenaceae bacterium]